MKIAPALIALMAGACLAAPAFAQSEDGGSVALGVGAGTLGGGVSAAFAVNRSLVVRAEGNFLGYDDDFNSSDVHYSGSLKFSTGLATLEYHPAGSGLFVAAGVLAGNRKADVTGTPTAGGTQTFTLNGVVYSVAQIAQVNGTVDLGNSAPFVGVGWDNTFSHAGKWGIRVSAGVAIGDTPKVHLNASGPLAADPIVQTNLRAEEASLAHDVKDFRNYPVVQISLTHRF